MKTSDWAAVRSLLPAVGNVKKSHGFVYFAVGASGLIKIGSSRAPLRRVTIMNGPRTMADAAARLGFDPGRAKVVAMVRDCGLDHEREIQSALSEEAIGGEWFEGERVRALVENLKSLATREVGFVNEGQRLLQKRLLKRGELMRLAKESGIGAPSLSLYRSGSHKPMTRQRVSLEELAGIPILSWDRPPKKEGLAA